MIICEHILFNCSQHLLKQRSELFISDLSTNANSKVVLKEKQKYLLHDEALINFGGIVRYNIKYSNDKSLITCALEPNFDDPDLKKSPPPN